MAYIDKLNNYITHLQSNEKKLFDQLVRDVNANITAKKEKIPFPFNGNWKIPEDNKRLYDLMNNPNKTKLDVEYIKSTTGDIVIFINNGTQELNSIASEYEKIYHMVVEEEKAKKDFSQEKLDAALQLRVFDPFVRELEDYYNRELPDRITQAMEKIYTQNGDRFQGKSEDVIKQVEQSYKGKGDKIKIKEKAADWMTADVYKNKNNGFVFSNHQAGYDTKFSNVENFKAGAKVSDAKGVSTILSNSGLDELPQFDDEHMKHYYNYYILGKDKDGNQMASIPGVVKFGQAVNNLIKKNNVLKNQIGIAYLQYEYGGFESAGNAVPFSTMFFTTKDGIFSLSQLLRYYQFRIDEEGLVFRSELAKLFQEWHDNDTYERASTKDSYVWAQYIRGYMKGI